MSATKSYSNRMAVVFDFDDTLITGDSFDELIKYLGEDPAEISQRYIEPMTQKGWQKYLARVFTLLEFSNQQSTPITRTTLVEAANRLSLIDGVDTIFDAIKNRARDVNPQVEVEFYLISGGFVDLPASCSIAHHFKQMWGCELHYSESDQSIQFIKTQMTHLEKTHYLYALSYGSDKSYQGDLASDYVDIPEEELEIPMSQVIYVADGTSDIPCFTVINQYKGMSFGIRKKTATEKWQHRNEISTNQRLTNLVDADYSEGSELRRSLLLATDIIAKRIELIQLSINE